MSIYVVDGKPRHGKTSFIVTPHINKWLREALEDGRKIFSNILLFPRNIPFLVKKYKDPMNAVGDIYSKKDRENPEKLIYYWENITEWEMMKHGRILCQEGTRYFNARQWQLLSPDTEIKLQQHGKDSLDIWVDTQHYTRLDQSLRVLVEKFYRVERTIGWGTFTARSIVSEHLLEDLERWERNPEYYKLNEKGEQIPAVEFWGFWPWRPFSKPYFDSTQRVGVSRAMPLRHIERFCPHPGCKLHKKPKISHI